jgi:predicted  nucleic acid-binding Zn-ribbon protein
LNKHLEQLIKLSNFDKSIVEFEPKIKEQNDKLSLFLKTVDGLNSKINRLYIEIDDAKNKRIKNDIHLKELATRLQGIKTKYDNVKTEKESRALQLEEEIAKEQIDFANNEIVRLDEFAANKQLQLEEFQKELAQEEEDIKEVQEAVNSTIAQYDQAKAEISKNKSELMDKIDQKVLTFYEKIKRWANETAVVEVKNQACYGCHMKLTNKVYSEFLATDEIMNCPHCGRIIYKSNEA